MLSRVADALFWMSRYLERAEQRPVCSTCASTWNWTCTASWPDRTSCTGRAWRPSCSSKCRRHIAQSSTPQAAISRMAHASTRTIPDSIMSCVARARANARSIRGTINSADVARAEQAVLAAQRRCFPRPGPRSRRTILPGRGVRQLPVPGRLRRDLHPRRGLAVHPARQISRSAPTRRCASSTSSTTCCTELTEPADLPLANLAMGGGAAQLPCLRGVPAALRRPDRAGARRRAYLLLHPIPALGALLPGSGGAALGAIEGRAPRPKLSAAERMLGLMLERPEVPRIGQIWRDRPARVPGEVCENRCAG